MARSVAARNSGGRPPASRKTAAGQGEARKGGAYAIAVLNRAVEIMNVFSPGRPSMSLKEITEATGLPKSTVFRILSTLVSHEFCDLDPNNGEYSLGFALVRLADIRRRQANLHTVALPVMRDIRNKLNETIVLAVRAGDTRVHIDSLEGLQAMRRTADLGVHAPLYAGASSKVLLAGMEDDEIEDYLARTELQQLQKSTIATKEGLRAEIRSIRKKGYAESKGELVAGGGAIAVPIKDFDGRTIAALDVLTPQHRYSVEHRDRCIAVMTEGALQISQRLGFRL